MKKLLLVYLGLLAVHIWTVVADGAGSPGSPADEQQESKPRTRTHSMSETETQTETETYAETHSMSLSRSESSTKTRPLPTMTPNNASVKDPPTTFQTTNLKGATVFLLHPKVFEWEEPMTCAQAAAVDATTSTKRTASAMGTQSNTVDINFGNVWPGNYVLCVKFPEDPEFYQAPGVKIQLLGEILPATSMIKGCTGQFTAGTEVTSCYLETRDEQGNITGSPLETVDIKIFIIDGDGEINIHTSEVTFEKRGKYKFKFTPQKAGELGTVRAYVRGELVNNYLIPKYTVVHGPAISGPKRSKCHEEGTHTRCTAETVDAFGNVVSSCDANCN